jgi:hypothetical protein
MLSRRSLVSIVKLVRMHSTIKIAASVQVVFSRMSGACRAPKICCAPPAAIPANPPPRPLCNSTTNTSKIASSVIKIIKNVNIFSALTGCTPYLNTRYINATVLIQHPFGFFAEERRLPRVTLRWISCRGFRRVGPLQWPPPVVSE